MDAKPFPPPIEVVCPGLFRVYFSCYKCGMKSHTLFLGKIEDTILGIREQTRGVQHLCLQCLVDEKIPDNLPKQEK